MKWIEVCIESDLDITEEVSMILLESGANGTQIQNPDEIKNLIDEAGASELADYEDFSVFLGKFKVIAYFATETDLEKIKAALKKHGLLFSFFWREVDDADWKGNWKKYYKEFDLTEKLKVVPSWESIGSPDDRTIIMDPGMAFGTGTHESTSLCTALIEKHLETGDVVLDIGTGTGILSIAASKLGAGFALALDIDPSAVKTAKQNFELNKIDNAQAFLGELKDVNSFIDNISDATFETFIGFDLIAANIVSDVIILLAEDMKKYIKEGGSLVCSGIIKERENDVACALRAAGFKNLEMRRKNEWTAMSADA